MSEETMQLVLETIQRSGDHKLVVELFDMYSAKYSLGMHAKAAVKAAATIPSSSVTNNSESTETTPAEVSTDPPVMIFTPPYPLQECPHIYHLVLHSLAKVRNFLIGFYRLHINFSSTFFLFGYVKFSFRDFFFNEI
jgi:hypothetical protein